MLSMRHKAIAAILALTAITSLPQGTIAASDCRVTEYPDHFDVVCIGNPHTGDGPGSPRTSRHRREYRPRTSDMTAAEAARLKLIRERRQREGHGETGAGPEPAK